MTDQQSWAKSLAEQSSDIESLKTPTNHSAFTFDLASAINKAHQDRIDLEDKHYGKDA